VEKAWRLPGPNLIVFTVAKLLNCNGLFLYVK
jgi:hypothetical protein